MDREGRVAIDPKVVGGRPVIKGTRVPIQVIVGSLAAGDTLAEVCEDYGLTEEDVRAALAYAADVLSQGRSIRFLVDEDLSGTHVVLTRAEGLFDG